MKKLRRFSLSRLSSGQSGQAFVLVLIFLMLGSLTLVPTLTHISTALKTGEVYEKNTDELYTADAGIEDSLWRIKYDFMGPDYNPCDFETAWPYQTEDLNGMTANFTIMNVWFPTDVNLVDPYAPGFIDLTPEEVSEMMDSEKLVVSGSALPGNPYRIMIDFNPDAGDNLTIKSLGVWLPSGFTYVPDSCSLDDGNPSTHPVWEPDNLPVTAAEAPGGWTVLWSYDAPYPYLADFPGFDSIDMTFDFSFSYTPPADHPTWLPAGVAWITTGMNGPNLNDVPVSWDVDTRYFKMVSEAGDTQIEAYSSKNDLRQMGDAMSGDYVAIGNALLLNNDGDRYRDDWATPSSFTLDSVPADADAVYAFLYWSGWRNEDAVTTVFSDTCSNFNHWVITGTAQNQTRVPNEDSSSDGDWTLTPGGSPSNYYSRIDETTPDDANYITGTTNGGGYRVFDFSDFSVPDGSEITGLTIYFRAKLVSGSSPDNNLRAYIRVDGDYTSGSSVDPGADWTTYSYTFTENPETGDPWTADDINGDSNNALERFGIRADHFNPDIQISMVYAVVEYYQSAWTIDDDGDDRFQGQGSGDTDPDPRTLTLKNPLDLSTPGIYSISWEQDEGGTLSGTDTLYYAFSGDGGDTWSPNYVAFSDDNPGSPFSRPIPQEYVTDEFMVRFYFNFNSSSEYVYLDDIEITYLPVDTDVVFKINDQQVYFDGSEPAVGPYKVTAGRSYAMLNYLSGPHGFSYMCVKDVSALVKAYPIVPGEEHHTGNSKYTVDDVKADTRNGHSLSEIAFANWSLIIVYASPQTAGHYIYIRDDNFCSHTSGDTSALDFDQDGIPGGTITGFKIPNPITDAHGQIIESIAAKLTCFIVEGDSWYYDDYLEVTGEQSDQSKYLSNPKSPYDNVWNDSSYPGTISDGVDIDTFEIKWTDGILTPKDKQLQVDMYSETDAWNLVYFIISVRSETVTSGTTYYTIRGG